MQGTGPGLSQVRPKGLVDSDDFSLNISREMLQKSPMLEKIADSIEKKIVATLKETMEKDPEKYQKFFAIYGEHIKVRHLSILWRPRRTCLQDLLIYPSCRTRSPISLKQYKSTRWRRTKRPSTTLRARA
jgi:molecular chaperone HtpG